MRTLKDELQVGTIKKGVELGKVPPTGNFIWHACEGCGKKRWVVYKGNKTRNKLCMICERIRRRGKNHHNWRGGRRCFRGYVFLWTAKDDFFYPMASKGGLILEHRLVMAKHLGRCLQPWEVIHHKNGIKNDNRIENLELTTNGQHHIDHNKGYKDGYAKGLIDGRNAQIQELKELIEAQTTQIKLLQWQLKEQGVAL